MKIKKYNAFQVNALLYIYYLKKICIYIQINKTRK